LKKTYDKRNEPDNRLKNNSSIKREKKKGYQAVPYMHRPSVRFQTLDEP
jgi:hypothetical protein